MSMGDACQSRTLRANHLLGIWFKGEEPSPLLNPRLSCTMVVMNHHYRPSKKEETTLQLIDIENLCGGSIQVGIFHNQVRDTVASFSKSKSLLTIVAAGPAALQSCPNLMWEWSHDRFLIGRGVDGADSRLLDVLTEPQLRRVTAVEIWSGDHCFSAAALSLVGRGIGVHVFSRGCALAESLRDSASEITILSNLDFLDAGQFAIAS